MEMPSIIAEWIASYLSKNTSAYTIGYNVEERIDETKKSIESLQKRLTELEEERDYGNERDRMILGFLQQFEIVGNNERLSKMLPDVIKSDPK
jgi:cell division protein FtsB